MQVLKSLTFTAVPSRGLDPLAARRSKLVERLEEQKCLLSEPSYVRVVQRWTGKGAERRQVEKRQRVKPWWRNDGAGHVIMAIYHGTKPIEFEKGKAGIAVQAKDKLPALIDQLITAVQAGELDELLARAGKPAGAAKPRRAA